MEISIEKAFDYLINNIHFFNVDFNKETEKGIKPFVELVFFYNLINDNYNYDKHKRKIIENYILSQINSNDFEKKLKDDVLGISGLSILEEFLIKRGSSKYRETLNYLIENKKIDLKIKRTPFRTMDMKYSLNKAQIKDNLSSYKEIFQDTILGKKLSLFYYSPSSAYSLTHTIFYITDMGNDYKIDNEIKDISFILQCLIGMHINNNDLDILAEVLLCVLFLNEYEVVNNRGIFDFGMKYIQDHQRNNGSFPAPIVSTSKDKFKRFKEDYHTTLVCLGALVCFQTKN